jgi:hypothetical protein
MPPAAPWDDPAFLVALGGTIALAAIAFVRRLPVEDRLTAGAALFAGTVLACTWLAVMLETPFGWVPAFMLAAVGLVWVRSDLPPMRLLFAASTPLALAFAGAGVTAGLDAAPVAIGLAIATLGAAVLAHLATPAERTVRVSWSLATGMLTIVTAVVAVVGPAVADDAWIVLLLLTPVPVLVAALFGDPIGGTSAAAGASWGTLVLAVASTWAWLDERGTDDVEAYTLPLAAGLFLAAGLIIWRRAAAGSTSTGRTAVLATAAAVAVLPSTATSGESELRTLVLVAAGAVLVIAGSFMPDLVRGVPARLLFVATGWIAATGAALLRGAAVATGTPSSLPVEFWPMLAFLVGLVAAALWARDRVRPTGAAEPALAASVVAAVIPTALAIAEGVHANLRTALLLSLLGALHVLGTTTVRRPFAGPVLSWTSLAGAAAVGGLALGIGAVDPFDLVTVPIGVALVIAGAVRLRRSSDVGSWQALGPGLSVLMIPALIADWTDPVLWRLVALGVVAVAAVVAGAMLRLQAPFVLGGAVLLVHAIGQLWPWISLLYEAVWWWLWLGIAGALLIAIAATYERQLRLARGAFRTISSLR